MRRSTVLYLLAVVMLVLCACVPADRTPTGSLTTLPSVSTSSSTASSSVTTVPTTLPTTQPSTAPHSHAYRATTIKQATCTADGTMLFDCDCGHSYTKTIAAKGHNWGQWLQMVSNTSLDPTGTYRVCSRCKAEERSLYYKTMLKQYTALAGCIGHGYSSPSQITTDEAARALAIVLAATPEFTADPSVATRTYSVTDLNKAAKKCFGKSFDFTDVRNLSMFGYGSLSYVESKSALVWTFPYGQDFKRNSAAFDSYIANDNNTKFTVKFHYVYTDGSVSDGCTLTVEYKNGNYVMTSISQ